METYVYVERKGEKSKVVIAAAKKIDVFEVSTKDLLLAEIIGIKRASKYGGKIYTSNLAIFQRFFGKIQFRDEIEKEWKKISWGRVQLLYCDKKENRAWNYITRKGKRLVAVDAVIFKEGKVLLIKRRNDPFAGKWCLPGGFVEFTETVEEAIKREVKEETGLEVRIVQLIGVFSSPERDPRGVVSIAYLCMRERGELRKGNEIEDISWFSLEEIEKMELGFDHKEIIMKAAPVAQLG